VDLDRTEITFKASKDNGQYQVYVDTESKDYSMLVYPLHVLATNRTCDTMISRKTDAGPFRFLRDFQNIRNVSWLFAGLLPYTINYARLFTDYQVYKKEDGLYEQC
jgi:hypothetical protein|tara:strand:- start:528 stop:845 length:318 start_codon:yes stop_codon:yes gene_type:complete